MEEPVRTDEKAERTALLHHMIHHNAHHAEEISELAETMKAENSEVSLLLENAVKCFMQGNKLLEQALEKLKED